MSLLKRVVSRAFLFPGIVLLLAMQGVVGVGQVEAVTKPEEVRVVIVGGGLAGLVAAYELQSRGISVHILESKDNWGGRVATAHYGNGLNAEFGMHEVWANDSLTQYMRTFKIPLSQPEQPFSSVYIDGKLYPYIQKSLDDFFGTLFTSGERKEFNRWRKEAQALSDELDEKGLTKALISLQSISYGKWVKDMNLPHKVEEFLRMCVECEVGNDWDQISGVYGIQQNDMFFHETEKCFHSREGNQKIIEAFVKAIRGTKTLGARVTRIVRAKNSAGKTDCIVYYLKDNVMRSIRAEKVVVAVPFQMLHAIQMEPPLTADQWKAITAIVPGYYLVVHFIIPAKAGKIFLDKGKNPFPVLTRGPLGVVYGFPMHPSKTFHPGNFSDIGPETHTPSMAFSGHTPHRGDSHRLRARAATASKDMVFSLLIHGDYARTYLEPLDSIRIKLLSEMDKIWPGFSKVVQGAYFYNYHPAAIPCWPPGHSPLDPLHVSLRQENEGLFLAGDYISTCYAEGAVQSGRDAARKISESLTKRNSSIDTKLH